MCMFMAWHANYAMVIASLCCCLLFLLLIKFRFFKVSASVMAAALSFDIFGCSDAEVTRAAYTILEGDCCSPGLYRNTALPHEYRLVLEGRGPLAARASVWLRFHPNPESNIVRVLLAAQQLREEGRSNLVSSHRGHFQLRRASYQRPRSRSRSTRRYALEL